MIVVETHPPDAAVEERRRRARRDRAQIQHAVELETVAGPHGARGTDADCESPDQHRRPHQ